MHPRSSPGWLVVPLLLAGCADALGPARPPAPQGPSRDLSYLLDYGYRVEAQVEIPLPEVSYTRHHSGTLPWRGTGVVLHEGDEAVLEVKGTVDVRLHPELLGIPCSEMVAPLERPNYCDVAADAVLETVGPDYYKEGWAAPVFRVGGSQLPLNFPFRGPGEIEMMRRGTWPPYYNQGILAPYHRYTGSQTVTVYVRRRQQPELTLTYSPNPVTRGQVIRCTAGKAANAPGELRVTGWSFEGESRVDGDVNSTEWNGVIVKGGLVEVRGTIGGRSAQPAQATIHVTDRTWAEAPVFTVREVTEGEDSRMGLPSSVTKAKDLGVANFFADATAGATPVDVVAEVNGGPNHNLYYFGDLSFPVYAHYILNYAAMSRGSAFYEAQEPESRGGGEILGGVNWCSRSVVPGTLRGLVLAHELRHIEVYKAAFTRELRSELLRLEQMTSASMSDLNDAYSDTQQHADLVARDESERIHQSTGNPNLVTPRDAQGDCALRNEHGQELNNGK